MPALFEENELAVSQIRWHQEYLSKFRSRGSSANNHVIAEAAGQLVAACAFPWFPESPRWRDEAAGLLQRELDLNTFPSGDEPGTGERLPRLRARARDSGRGRSRGSGHPLDQDTWRLLARMADAGASVLDASLHGPRQGDGDEGRALVIDDPEANRWSTLLATAATLVGTADWWPHVAGRRH